jgi:two-component system chemotaxis response regulator CheV
MTPLTKKIAGPGSSGTTGVRATDQHVHFNTRSRSRDVQVAKFTTKGHFMNGDHIQALLFKLAGAPDTLFAINLFKVLEIVNAQKSVSPALVRHPACSGVAHMRDNVVPIIDLSRAVFGEPARSKLWLWCEFARRQVAFEIAEVLQLVEIPWASMKPAQEIAGYGKSTSVTGVLQLEDGRLATLLDVDQIVVEVLGPGEQNHPVIDDAQEVPILSGKRVLFADDSRMARVQLRALLEHMGAEVIECVDGEDAEHKLDELKLASGAKPLADSMPLVVTDIEMPRMDGYSLARHIRADRGLDGVKVVMYSSLAADQSQRLGKDCGADEFISKFSDQALSDAISRLVPHEG